MDCKRLIALMSSSNFWLISVFLRSSFGASLSMVSKKCFYSSGNAPASITHRWNYHDPFHSGGLNAYQVSPISVAVELGLPLFQASMIVFSTTTSSGLAAAIFSIVNSPQTNRYLLRTA
jgi:hypothetical protein